MAIFRKINIDFWEDSKIVDDFTPEDKYFYLYLMTNPHTSQLGCYGLTIRQMEFETGYNKDTILKLIKRFSENLDVILYDEDTKEILIKNWHKYNWTSSPKVIACIFKEFKEVKSTSLQAYLDTVFIEYGYHIDTVSIPKCNKNKNKNKNKNNKEIFDNFDSTFRIPTLGEIEQYCKERNNNIDARKFFDYYQEGGWKDSQGKAIKSWKQKLITWERKDNTSKSSDMGGLY